MSQRLEQGLQQQGPVQPVLVLDLAPPVPALVWSMAQDLQPGQ
jgi:hypothetical protein